VVIARNLDSTPREGTMAAAGGTSGRTASEWAGVLEADLFESVLPFWLLYSEDAEHGGFFDCLDANGRVYDTTKHVWLQGRQVFMLARIANEATNAQLGQLRSACERRAALELGGPAVVGLEASIRAIEPSRQGLKDAARRGLDFLLAHAEDPATGHVWFALTADGRASAAQRKPFSAAFLALAISEVARAEESDELFALAKSWYDRYGVWAADPSLLRGPAPAGAKPLEPMNLPMIALNLVSELGRYFKTDAEREAFEAPMAELRAAAVRDVMKHWHPELSATLENVRADGGVDPSGSDGRLHLPGHAIEAAWFVMEEALRTGDDATYAEARRLGMTSLEAGWDGPLPGCAEPRDGPGGLVYFMDALGADATQLEADMKLWWPLCEAMIFLAMDYRRTGDAATLRRFDAVAGFAMDRFSDGKPGMAGPGAGEWVGYLSRDARVTHSFKGGPYKGCFHVPRALFVCTSLLREAAERHEKPE